MPRTIVDEIKVPAVEKTLDIIECVADHGKLTIKDLSQKLAIANSTTFRIVKNLSKRGYLKAESEGYYTIGIQFVYLSQAANMQSDIISMTKDNLVKLAEKSGQTAQLGVLQEGGVMYLDQAQPSKPVSIIATVGTVIPINVSAAGKVLLANLSEDRRREFLSNAILEKRTKNSIDNLEQFSKELDNVKSQGFALDIEEFARGIGCIAAPIYNKHGKCLAAIGITGHINAYLAEEQYVVLNRIVLESAQEVSRKFGYVNSKLTQ